MGFGEDGEKLQARQLPGNFDVGAVVPDDRLQLGGGQRLPGKAADEIEVPRGRETELCGGITQQRELPRAQLVRDTGDGRGRRLDGLEIGAKPGKRAKAEAGFFAVERGAEMDRATGLPDAPNRFARECGGGLAAKSWNDRTTAASSVRASRGGQALPVSEPEGE